MIKKCKNCKYYANTNLKMRNGNKEIVGDYCLKFKWNLSRMKTWDEKLSDKKVVNFSSMKMIPENCYESK